MIFFKCAKYPFYGSLSYKCIHSFVEILNLLMKTKHYLFLLFFNLTLYCSAQYNYFNFSTSQLNTESCMGDGMVNTPSNELFYRSSYGYMCLAYGTNYSNVNILWSTQLPRATSEIVYGDNKIFYIDDNLRLRQLSWTNNQWMNGELNNSSPSAANGKGLVFVGNSTLYYVSNTNIIYKVFWNGSTWAFESTGATAKSGSRICFGNNKLFFVNTLNRICSLVKSGSVWLNSELNTSSPGAEGSGLAFGDNSNIYYTNTAGKICNIYYSGSWNFNTVPNAVSPKTGSKIMCDHNTLYYVGNDNNLYTLLYDNCDWFNKKIHKTATPKAESIYFAANKVFYRNISDNKVYGAATSVATNQPYVYLKGKIFNKDNQPFYPVVMNYLLNLNSSEDPNITGLPLPDLWVSPDHQIFPTNICSATDQDSANVFLASDFARLKSLGFNTLRLVGLAAMYNKTGDSSTKISVVKSPDADHGFQVNYTATGVKAKLFNAIENVLTLANDAGLKVILLAGDSYIHRTDGASANYVTYLGELANNFKNNSTILAYDLDNEPGAKWQITNDKQTNCAQSKAWYDAIRAYDMNHLITMGIFGREDLANWDPNILSVDFLSFHVYGWPFTSNLNSYQNRYLAQLKWIQNNIKTPWIIGETSVSAINNSFNCQSNTVTGWNTEIEQQQFAAYSQTKTRSAGGSGYSWWAYHDITHTAATPSEAFEGIYSLCDRKKPSADEFNENHNWLNYTCNNLPVPADIDYYNYDPNITYPYTIIGRLVDGNNGFAPIKDGIIIGRAENQPSSITFSKSDGTFKVCSNTLMGVIDCSSMSKEKVTRWNPVANVGDIVLYNIPSCSISNNVRLMSPNEDVIVEPEDVNIEVYPNPSNNYINISNNFKNDFKVEIYDMLGKLIFSKNYKAGDNTIRIDYNDLILSNNMVVFKISDNNTSINKKVLIIK